MRKAILEHYSISSFFILSYYSCVSSMPIFHIPKRLESPHNSGIIPGMSMKLQHRKETRHG